MIRLVETFSATKNNIKELPLTESTLTEEKTGKVYETKKKYRVDVSRFTKNLNERIYSKTLWEKVIKDQRHIWEGSFALADHPTDEGSFKDVMGVWSNLHINEASGTVKADITFVGTYGAKAIEILEAGGKIGFSSSGFGDLKEDGCTVDENTYMIERVADCVLNPSQQVFGTIQDAIEEKTTNYMKDPLKENIKMSVKQSKLEEKIFKTTIEGYLNEIKNSQKLPSQKLKEYKELLTYFSEEDTSDLKKSIEDEIEGVEDEIEESVSTISSFKETFGTHNPEDFKEGLTKLALETQLNEKQVADWKMIAENLQETILNLQTELKSRPTLEQYDSLVTSKKELKERYVKRIETLQKVSSEKEKNLDENARIYEEMLNEIKKAVKTIKETEAKLFEAKKQNKQLILEISSLKKEMLDKNKFFEKTIAEITAVPEVKIAKTNEQFRNFTESNKIEQYYNDLERQHGKAILRYKEKILGCKTLFEAMRIYTSALVEMSDNIYTIKTGDVKENKKMVESATGIKIGSKRTLNKPETWE
jgi:hypothetical protein